MKTYPGLLSARAKFTRSQGFSPYLLELLGSCDLRLMVNSLPERMGLSAATGSRIGGAQIGRDRDRTMNQLKPRPDQFVRFPAETRPRLIVSVDAEEEFDWSKLATRGPYTVESMKYRWRAQTIFERYGICPTYMIDFPVAENEYVSQMLAEMCAAGRCTVGAHLHPWTNPPHEEELSTYTSFPGNLSADLEKRKLQSLTELIATKFQQRPTVYRAGRYGIGPATANILRELGYLVDMSVIPMRDYSRLGGPDFSRLTAKPYWFGAGGDLLEIPLTAGYTGALRSIGSSVASVLNRPLLNRARVPGVLARSQLLNRIYVTPEGMPVEEAKRLTEVLLKGGQRIFTLHYHSPSLAPGNTPYVNSHKDLERFLSWLEIYFDFFIGELGGVGITPMEVYAWAQKLRADASAAAPTPAAAAPSSAAVRGLGSIQIDKLANRVASGPRCLIVATNFPPVRGGSAVVYENLCKWAAPSVVVLTAWRNYATNDEIAGWRRHDRAEAFPIYRLEMLRPPITHSAWPIANIISLLFSDLPLMLRVFRKVRAIVRNHRIEVICIGELVYGGWLVLACRYLLGCKVIQYVHGEEITINGTSRSERMKRIYLRLSDAVIAVSRFTRDALLTQMAVEPRKVALIENGVDTSRFYEKPRSDELLERHGLAGKRIVLSVGRLVARKGFDTMLMALPQLLRSIPDLQYVIVGEGPYHSELERIANEQGIAGNVTFVGRVSDDELVDYYGLADVFVLPNREMPDGDTEGFGLVYLEANACGKPVVSGRAGGVLDAVEDGVNGIAVDGTDPAAITAAVQKLLQDDELYARLRNGALEAAQKSSWSRRTEQFNRLCQRVVAEPA